jgi:hypothetical protein
MLVVRIEPVRSTEDWGGGRMSLANAPCGRLFLCERPTGLTSLLVLCRSPSHSWVDVGCCLSFAWACGLLVSGLPSGSMWLPRGLVFGSFDVDLP